MVLYLGVGLMCPVTFKTPKYPRGKFHQLLLPPGGSVSIHWKWLYILRTFGEDRLELRKGKDGGKS